MQGCWNEGMWAGGEMHQHTLARSYVFANTNVSVFVCAHMRARQNSGACEFVIKLPVWFLK